MYANSLTDQFFDPEPYKTGIDAIYSQSWTSYPAVAGQSAKIATAAGIASLAPVTMAGFWFGVQSALARHTCEMTFNFLKAGSAASSPSIDKEAAIAKAEKALEVVMPQAQSPVAEKKVSTSKSDRRKSSEAPKPLSVANMGSVEPSPVSQRDAAEAKPLQKTATQKAVPVKESSAPKNVETASATGVDGKPAIQTLARQDGKKKAPVAGEIRDPQKSDTPAFLKGPKNGSADDLKLISGIGPKIETILNDLGIYHFDQIAAWTPDQVRWIDDHLKFSGRIVRENWIAQARSKAKPASK